MNYSLVSNNCISIFIYALYEPEKHHSLIEYTNPFIGSWFSEDDHYVKFCENYDYYTSIEPIFGEPKFGRPSHIRKGTVYPVMTLGDIEIRWQHEHKISLLLKKFKGRMELSNNLEKIFLWCEPFHYNEHTLDERNLLVKRFCSMPDKKIYLTKYKNEEKENSNTIIKYIPEYKNLDTKHMIKDGLFERPIFKECIDKFQSL